MSLNIEIENVGGFMHTKIIPGLERGLNTAYVPASPLSVFFGKLLPNPVYNSL